MKRALNTLIYASIILLLLSGCDAASAPAQDVVQPTADNIATSEPVPDTTAEPENVPAPEPTLASTTETQKKPDGKFFNGNLDQCPYYLTYEEGMISFEFYFPEYQPDQEILPFYADEYVVSYMNKIYYTNGECVYEHNGDARGTLIGLKPYDKDWIDLEQDRLYFGNEEKELFAKTYEANHNPRPTLDGEPVGYFNDGKQYTITYTEDAHDLVIHIYDVDGNYLRDEYISCSEYTPSKDKDALGIFYRRYAPDGDFHDVIFPYLGDGAMANISQVENLLFEDDGNYIQFADGSKRKVYPE